MTEPMSEAQDTSTPDLQQSNLLPDSEFAHLVHKFALQGSKARLDLPMSTLMGLQCSSQDLARYAHVSPFHWQASARLATMLTTESQDELAELHWNAVMANVAVTGEFFWRSSSLRKLKKLQDHSQRALQLANINYCFWNPTIEAFSDCLQRRDLTELERLIITYGEACCFAVRKDEERFEHSAELFCALLQPDKPEVPALVAPAYHLVQVLRQMGKSSSAVTASLLDYMQYVRVHHPSPYMRLHADILFIEDTLISAYWGGSIHQKIDWTLQALNTLSFAITCGTSTSWYGYLQYVIAQRSSYSGIYDIAREMITDLERQHSPYALGAKGYYLAELEKFDGSSDIYEEFLRQVEREQTAAHRGEIDHPPVVKQSDMAFCYYYAAQSLFHLRSEPSLHIRGQSSFDIEDGMARCAEMIEKFFVWSEYLSAPARRVLNEICRAMQAELSEDLSTAVEHYERYLEFLSGDDYISRIKTLSRIAQIYAEELNNFEKADEHLQTLKKLLPTIQKNSSIPLEQIDTETSRSQTTTVQLWLTNYSLKATQKVLSALDTVTSQLASAYQLVEEQNNKLTEVNHNLVDLNNEKNEFLGIVAHDLKSPLSGIVLAIDMLEKYVTRMTFDQRQKKLQDIRHTAQRMSGIITNLLDINAIETGKFNFTMTSFSFTEAVRRIVEDYQERASVKNIMLHFAALDDYPAFADANATAEILDNLISNAVKYSPHGKNVYVRVLAEGNRVRCEVQDEGPGLSEEDKAKLFGKFARLSAKPTGGEHSTGLGLSIVKKLAETMHGNVWCESVLGEGATFVVEMPMQALETALAVQI
jgi:signal transduction histidine kinase